MKYTKTHESLSGLHIEFAEPITADNFKQACQAAIDLAKTECVSQKAVAVNFVALGVSVQVVEADEAETQFELWQRRLGNLAETRGIVEPVHDVLERLWKKAGKPVSACEMVLWDLQRLIDGTPTSRSEREIVSEAVEMLEQWILCFGPATPEELAAIRVAVDFYKADDAPLVPEWPYSPDTSNRLARLPMPPVEFRNLTAEDVDPSLEERRNNVMPPRG